MWTKMRPNWEGFWGRGFEKSQNSLFENTKQKQKQKKSETNHENRFSHLPLLIFRFQSINFWILPLKHLIWPRTSLTTRWALTLTRKKRVSFCSKILITIHHRIILTQYLVFPSPCSCFTFISPLPNSNKNPHIIYFFYTRTTINRDKNHDHRLTFQQNGFPFRCSSNYLNLCDSWDDKCPFW